MGGLFGDLVGELSGQAEEDRDRVALAEAERRASGEAAANAYGRYRVERHQAKMNALANRMAMYQPVNDAMATMYGQNAAPSYNQALQTPMSSTMLQQGTPWNPGFQKQRSREETENIFGPNAPLEAYLGASADQGPPLAYGAQVPTQTEAQYNWQNMKPPAPKKPVNTSSQWPGSGYVSPIDEPAQERAAGRRRYWQSGDGEP